MPELPLPSFAWRVAYTFSIYLRLASSSSSSLAGSDRSSIILAPALKFIPSKEEWTASPISACLYRLFPPIMCFCFGTPLVSFILFFGPFYRYSSASAKYACCWFKLLLPSIYSLWPFVKFYEVFPAGFSLLSDKCSDLSSIGLPNNRELISEAGVICFCSFLGCYSSWGIAIY